MPKNIDALGVYIYESVNKGAHILLMCSNFNMFIYLHIFQLRYLLPLV
jgi:hypothetical protein